MFPGVIPAAPGSVSLFALPLRSCCDDQRRDLHFHPCWFSMAPRTIRRMPLLHSSPRSPGQKTRTQSTELNRGGVGERCSAKVEMPWSCHQNAVKPLQTPIPANHGIYAATMLNACETCTNEAIAVDAVLLATAGSKLRLAPPAPWARKPGSNDDHQRGPRAGLISVHHAAERTSISVSAVLGFSSQVDATRFRSACDTFSECLRGVFRWAVSNGP